jgi:hypothetical protein
MIIKRTTATQIMSKAIQLEGACLLAILHQDESITYCNSKGELDTLIESNPDATWVYNQNPDASEIIDQIIRSDGQTSLEVFQDTRGVFGLRAYQMIGKLQTPVTLELSDIHS